jgi:hypothetical protein
VPGAPARLTAVGAAERAAGSKASQDRIVVLPDAVAVLDGASAPDPSDRDGGWYAARLAEELTGRLGNRKLDLPTVLGDSIAAVTNAYRLVPGSSPSSTVTLLRWDESRVDGLVLGDSPLVVFGPAGRPEVVVDDRLAAVAPAQRVAYHDRLAAGGGYDDGHRALLRDLVGEQRRHRNRPDGYWIAEATPAAARQALTRSWPAAAVTTALLASDGVSRGIGRAVSDWPAALTLVDAHGPGALLDAVRAPEQADPDGRRWPRSKPYDDQALVVIRFLDSESVGDY